MVTRTRRRSAATSDDSHLPGLNGDPFVTSALASELLATVLSRLTHRFPNVPRDDISQAVSDAVLDYITRPGQFDHTKGIPLDAFIELAARRNLSNLIRAHARRAKREREYWREHLRLRLSASHTGYVLSYMLLQQLVRTLEPQEVTAFRLWIYDGRKDTGRLSAVLGGAECLEKQRRLVKRFKDKVRARLRRIGERVDPSAEG